jgi:hypothetical protein
MKLLSTNVILKALMKILLKNPTLIINFWENSEKNNSLKSYTMFPKLLLMILNLEEISHKHLLLLKWPASHLLQNHRFVSNLIFFLNGKLLGKSKSRKNRNLINNLLYFYLLLLVFLYLLLLVTFTKRK